MRASINAFNALLESCVCIAQELPCASASVHTPPKFETTTSGIRQKCIRIMPRDARGARCAYIYLEDISTEVAVVQAATDVSSSDSALEAQTSLSSAGDIDITCTLNDSAIKKVRISVRVCGVLLVDIYTRITFDAQTCVKIGQHTFQHAGQGHRIAINASGTRLVMAHASFSLDIFELPSFKHVSVLDTRGHGRGMPAVIWGICFTSADTLLHTDYKNDCVNHWTADGFLIKTIDVFRPRCVAIHGDTIGVGCSRGVNIFSLESGARLHTWKQSAWITSIAFIDARTLVIANLTMWTVGLYALNGDCIKHLEACFYDFFDYDYQCYGLAVCTDTHTLLVSDYTSKCIRVYSTSGQELPSAAFTKHAFQHHPLSIAIHGAHAFVHEYTSATESRVCIFE